MATPTTIQLHNRQITLMEFGRISTIHESDRWVNICNEKGKTLRMNKTFHRWPKVLRKCNRFMTQNTKTITRCGAASFSTSHFNEIYIDPAGASLLDFPTDGQKAPNTVEQMIMERIWKQEVWSENISDKVLKAERARFKESLEHQSERDHFLTERTTSYLNEHYQQFAKKQILFIYIDEHTRRRAAMRLGINLIGHSSLKVHLEGHLHNTNLIHVTLPDFEGIDGVIGLHRKEDGNQWISTINNGDTEWWEHEEKIAVDKDADQPITYYLELFFEIQRSRYDIAKKEGSEYLSEKTVIKFPGMSDG